MVATTSTTSTATVTAMSATISECGARWKEQSRSRN